MKYSKEEKAKWLEDWRKSGKGAWAFARANSLKPQTFINWTKPRGKKKSFFVEIPIKAQPSNEEQKTITIERGDIKIHVPLGFRSDELRSILTAMKDAV